MDTVKNIAIIFLSIFFEALPFLLLGSLISSIIEEYISNEVFEKIIPKNIFLGSLVGVFLGFFIPACDCAVIPISKRLIKKKVPLNVAISFMLASPIINPVVLFSTYTAFYNINKEMFWLRLILGILIALLVGIIMGILFKKNVIKNSIEEFECDCKHDNHDKKGFKSKFIDILNHTSYDLFDILKYLMFGAFLASLAQVLLPRNIIEIFSNSNILSIIILMIFAYLTSLCSTSDSFVGKSFLKTFTKSGILAYLLLGPMIDIKNTIVLLGNYKSKFVFFLIFLIFITIFIFSLLITRFI